MRRAFCSKTPPFRFQILDIRSRNPTPFVKLSSVNSTNHSRPEEEIEKFEVLFRQIPAAMALLRGPEFIFEMANDDYHALVGRNTILGKTLIEALPELKNQSFPEILKNVYATGVEFKGRELEVSLERGETKKRLETFYVDVTYQRVLDRQGQPYGIFAFAMDVTEKVKARSSVQLEQQKLEAVVANASSSLALLYGPTGIFERVNASYLNLFNGRPILGKPILEALPELTEQKFPGLISEVYETGKPYVETEALAYLRRSSDSPLEERFFDQSYIRINDIHGDRYGVMIQAIDVTERVHNRKELVETAERFQSAVNAANMGTWSFDFKTNALNCSARTSELFEYPIGKAMPMEYALQKIHEDDRPLVEAEVKKAIDANGNGKYDIEHRIKQNDGSDRWVSLRGKTLFRETKNGRETLSFTGTILDVTDRILSEQIVRHNETKFRRLADLMPQVVWTARPDGVLDYTNARWTQYSGSSDPAQWITFVHPEDQPGAIVTWTNSVMSGAPYQTEFRLKRAADNEYRWFLVRAQAATNDAGEIESWFGTCTDIEDQKKILSERSNFISIASHELKTPLTSLKLQTQSMRRNFEKKREGAFSPDKVNQLINNNEKQIGRLIRLVDDMLDFSKIEAGKLSMHMERSEICELVGEVHDRLKEQLDAAGCESSVDCQGPIHLMIDRFRIEQVITNLLTNAIRYGKGKPVSIRVLQDGSQMVISVTDRGMGIAPENVERIFHRFERAVSANEVSGLGLGLFISGQIVEAHSGKIRVESQLEHGSTFTIELPVENKL